MEKLDEIAQIIRKQKDLAVVSHIIPDGDAIGSILALGLALDSLEYNVQLINPDGVPKIYTFLPGSDLIRSRFLYIPETVIFLDCSDIKRIGNLRNFVAKAKRIINIDHHVSNTFFGDINYVDTKASATGEIIYHLINTLKGDLDTEIATCIYTAIVTDTGSFQYENTTIKTHLITADLLAHGVDLGTVRRFLWESTSLKSIKLLTEILKTLEIDDTSQIAWIYLPYKVFQKFGANPEYVEGMVNYPKSIEGVEIGIFFKEIEPGKIKVGLRSKTKVDVNKLAQKFGGGGHKRAAGCTVEAPLEEAVKIVVEEAKKFFHF